jgi:epoxyqueuosine reductase QueG
MNLTESDASIPPPSEGQEVSIAPHYACPTCQRPLYDRRLTHCGYCGALIPDSLRFTPEQMAAHDRANAELEAQRRLHEHDAAAARQAESLDGDLDFSDLTVTQEDL